MMEICPSLTNIMITKNLRFRHHNALGMVGYKSFACLLELSWIFPGASLKINGAPCGVQGGLTGMHLKCWYNQLMGWKLSVDGGRGHRLDELVTVFYTVTVMVILNMLFMYVYFVSGCNKAFILSYLILSLTHKAMGYEFLSKVLSIKIDPIRVDMFAHWHGVYLIDMTSVYLVDMSICIKINYKYV